MNARSKAFLARAATALLVAAYPRTAGATPIVPAKCGRVCSPSLEVGLGYVAPVGLRPSLEGARLPDGAGQAVVAGAVDFRLLPGRGFLVPLLGVSAGGGVGPSSPALHAANGTTVTFSPLAYGTILLPGFGLVRGDVSFVLRGAVAGVKQDAVVTKATAPSSSLDASGFLGLGLVGDLAWCPSLGRSSEDRLLRACLFAQPAAYEHGFAVASGLRLTAF